MQTIKQLAMTMTLFLEGLQATIQGDLWKTCSAKKAVLQNSKELQNCQLKLWPKSLNNTCQGPQF